MTRSEENDLLIIIERLRDDIVKAFEKHDYDIDYHVNAARAELQELALTLQARNAYKPNPQNKRGKHERHTRKQRRLENLPEPTA